MQRNEKKIKRPQLRQTPIAIGDVSNSSLRYQKFSQYALLFTTGYLGLCQIYSWHCLDRATAQFRQIVCIISRFSIKIDNACFKSNIDLKPLEEASSTPDVFLNMLNPLVASIQLASFVCKTLFYHLIWAVSLFKLCFSLIHLYFFLIVSKFVILVTQI